jgi:hypothetical protein
MSRKKKKKPELKVVFDTSILFSRVAHDLVRNEVKELIENNSNHKDLVINWYFPQVVIDERRYQMQNRAFDLLPSIQKLEKLLGHNLNINEEILTSRVKEAVDKQLKELKCHAIEADPNEIDWKSLIKRAVFREPPFEPGEKEKGFRDSIIAESFLQLVKTSPITPSVCRLILITNDGKLKEFITNNTKDAKNVQVIETIKEIESLINVLVSNTNEAFINKITDKVEDYFFNEKNKTGLYFKENIQEQIESKYKQELNAVPLEGLPRENVNWQINGPVFVKKERQRVFWITQIDVEAKIFSYETPSTFTKTHSTSDPSHSLYLYENPEHTYSPSSIGELEEPAFSAKISLPNFYSSYINLNSAINRMELYRGKSSFNIHWSVNITQRENLTSPSIEEIEFLETKWE